MKKLALIASFVLGTAGVAAAAPGPAMHSQVAAQTFYRPGRPVPVKMNRWTLLDTQSTRAGRNVIAVSSAQKFTKLKIEATRGSAVIDKVLVTFGNGRTQTIDLNQRIAGSQSALIDLNGGSRQITKIVVLSKGRAMGSYQVLAA